MGLLSGVAITVAVMFGMIALFINVIMVLSVRNMAQPDGLLEVIEHGPTVLAEGLEYAERHRWATDHGFTPDLVADFRGAMGGQVIVIGVWRNFAEKTYLSTYNTPQKMCCEFITILDRDASLTTTNTRDSVLMPSGHGRFIQAFDGANLDALLRRHQEGLDHLSLTQHLEPINRSETTDLLILESLHHQTTYVQSLPLWQLRGAWWYWGRRNLLNNKSIAERYPRG
jgi:hypothetical protein